MSDLIIPRRRFLQGMATLFVAPAIIKASSLMPVKSWREVLIWPVPPGGRSVTFFGGRLWWLHDSDLSGMFYSDVSDWLSHPKASEIEMRPTQSRAG
jgi:hypothetical protein